MSSVPTYDQYEEPTAELTMDIVDEVPLAPVGPARSQPPSAKPQSPVRPEPTQLVVAVGQLLGHRYQLTELIGRGGSSLVFRATDLDAGPEGPRVVAVKTLDPERPRANGTDRLRQEFAVAKSLSHPGIVRVFDFEGGGADAAAFFTMELLEGRTLASAMREAGDAGMPADQVKSVLRAAGEALIHAHQRGVVHGDFKPANVFLSRDGIRILDFGNAANGDDGRSQDHRAATTCYASPELLLGQRPQQPDDVFSFACVAYELLNGKHPFGRQSALDARAARRVPVRPWSLREAQWQSLDAALGFNRDTRPTLDAVLASLLTDPPKAPSPPLLSQVIPAKVASASRQPPESDWISRAAVAVNARSPTPAVPAVALRFREQAEAMHSPVYAGSRMQSPAPLAAKPDAPPDEPVLSKATREFIASALATAALLMTLVIVVTEWNSYPALKDDVTSAIASFLGREVPVQPAPGLTSPVSGGAATDVATPSSTGEATAQGSDLAASSQTGATPTANAAQARISRTPATPASARTPDPRRRTNTAPSPTATYLAFAESAVTVGERTSAVALSVQRSGSLTSRSSIRWRATAGTARAVQDFTASSGTVSFPEGHALRVLYIPLVNDTVPEDTEQFFVELREPDAASRAGPVARVTVTITDDD